MHIVVPKVTTMEAKDIYIYISCPACKDLRTHHSILMTREKLKIKVNYQGYRMALHVDKVQFSKKNIILNVCAPNNNVKLYKAITGNHKEK